MLPKKVFQDIMIWNDFSMLISILILCSTVSIFGLYHTTDMETNADIIEQFTTVTTTECIMICNSNPKCDSIARDGNYCLLLTRKKNVTKSKGNATFHAIKPIGDNVTFSTKQSQVTCCKWSEFSECSKTCGIGIRMRKRACYDENENLVRIENSTENCTKQECPPTCREWSQFGACSKTCGTGDRKRSRGCYNDKGILVRTDDSSENCNEQECPPTCREWSQFSTCTKTCGTGEHKRSRKCYNDKGILVRTDESTENCNEQDCPVACKRTTGGTAGETCCVFPFIYKGNTYDACTYANHDQLWCATDAKFPDPYSWANCID